MIKIENKQDCCGCAACTQVCPKHCIAMVKDAEGFLYPNVELEKCVDCNMCQHVCPILNKADENIQDAKAFAAYDLDEKERLQSSSGGIFSLLAKQILREGGVVYGAAMSEDCTSVCHIKAESPDELAALRGSKYIQSSTEGVYQQIKNELDNGRKVLFSGTPCQIAGLKSFLRADYENLLCVGVICHGVPSSKLWRKYLRYREDCAGAPALRTFLGINIMAGKCTPYYLSFQIVRRTNKSCIRICLCRCFCKISVSGHLAMCVPLRGCVGSPIYHWRIFGEQILSVLS